MNWCLIRLTPIQRPHLKRIANQLEIDNSIEGLILGGTELSLILEQSDFENLHVFDSTKIHVSSLVKMM